MPTQPKPRTDDVGGPTSFNLMKWIAENPDKLKPPLGAKTVFREDDFMVTVVGGPNARTDYHVNPTEEFFFQIKGDVAIGIQHNGKPYDILLPEGSIYLLPANVPHAPRRGPNTVGLIVERIRKNGLTDTHRWYCEKCNGVLFEKTVKIEVLERDMPPIFDAYYGNPDNQVRFKLIADLAASHRLPSVSAESEFAKDGGLMYYGVVINILDQMQQAAAYVDRILKGAKPGDLPIQQIVRSR